MAGSRWSRAGMIVVSLMTWSMGMGRGWASPSEGCGDGVVQVLEECDLGPQNGQQGSCCRSDCRLQAPGSVCRPAADVCDMAETCNGLTDACPADGFRSDITLCRAASGPCDGPEYCTGFDAACPSDGFYSSVILCRAATDLCDQAEFCTGFGPLCPPDVVAPATRTCRHPADSCDVAEHCDGANKECPADALRPSTFRCRTASAACDIDDYCTGSSAACPNAYQPAGTICRPAAGACDVSEVCTGSGPACPSDAFLGTETVCRPPLIECDQPEHCTGLFPACPVPSVQPVIGPCDDGDPCTGEDFCNEDLTCAGIPLTVPLEVARLDVLAEKTVLEWTSAGNAGPGTVHDLLRGVVHELPVGSGPSEVCVASGVGPPVAQDDTVPSTGEGFWYLVRGRNTCGTGAYGTTSSGVPEVSTACP